MYSRRPEGQGCYVCDFQVFMTKVRSGTFSALNVSFENASSMTPLLIDYGLEASLRVMRPSIALFNLLGVDKKSMRSRLGNNADELKDYVKDTGFIGFILVTLDSMTAPILNKATRNKRKELKKREEHLSSWWKL